MKPDRIDNPLDNATSKRLQRLASMPMDTSRLDGWMKTQFGTDNIATNKPRLWFQRRSIMSVAAAVVIAIVIGVMSLTSTHVVAAPLELSEIHNRVTAGSLASVTAADLVDARNQLKALVEGSPRPDGDYPTSVRCCCGQTLPGERLVFVTTHYEQTPITIVLMRGYHVCAGDGHEKVDEHGRRFIVHHDHAGVQATLTPRDDYWICILGALPTDKLIEVGGQIAF